MSSAPLRDETHVEQRQSKLLDSLKKAAFVIGTALVVFVAARNSITWHLEQFWGASGDFWQTQWAKIHNLFGGDPFNLAIYGKHKKIIIIRSRFFICDHF